MDQSTLNTLIRQADERRLNITQNKGKEYHRSEDVLANFKRLGDWLAPLLKTESKTQAAMIVCMIYKMKHVDAIQSFVANLTEYSEPIEGRIDDDQNYDDLLRGLIAEHQTQEG